MVYPCSCKDCQLVPSQSQFEHLYSHVNILDVCLVHSIVVPQLGHAVAIFLRRLENGTISSGFIKSSFLSMIATLI